MATARLTAAEMGTEHDATPPTSAPIDEDGSEEAKRDRRASRLKRLEDDLHGWHEDSAPLKERSGRWFERKSSREKHQSAQERATAMPEPRRMSKKAIQAAAIAHSETAAASSSHVGGHDKSTAEIQPAGGLEC